MLKTDAEDEFAVGGRYAPGDAAAVQVRTLFGGALERDFDLAARVDSGASE
jgi:hypothetical protein